METKYSNQKNVLILIKLLKEHGIKKIVASPGTSNMPLVASAQQDDFFEVYSSVDERSAAYIACGMAAEKNEPVVITCTGATASRNYMSGLTEAFYRKLPILAITSTQDISRLGQNAPQLIDRRVIPNDIAKMSIHLPSIYTLSEERNYAVLINSAILELTRNGGGPVHINLTIADGRKDYDITELPNVNVISRINNRDVFPELPNGKIGIYVGSHNVWSKKLTKNVEEFCRKFNAVVLVDNISNYKGEYAVFSNIVTYQGKRNRNVTHMDLLIHIGDIVGTDFQGLEYDVVWRVNPDSEVRNTFGKLKHVFEMEEYEFFEYYVKNHCSFDIKNSYIKLWNNEIKEVRSKISELPFSNIWIAQKTANKLPKNSVIHFAIQNSLRCWNFFETDKSISGFCNTGGFGIDGNLSSMIGASIVSPDKLFYCVIGDLAFFYDMNVLGNRHILNNVRIILINNNGGQQFRNYDSSGYQFGSDVNKYMAASGHYGNSSKTLVKNYVQSLGFKYLKAENKEEYLSIVDEFVSEKLTKQPMLLEIFVGEENERNAMDKITHLKMTNLHKKKIILTNIIGEKKVKKIEKIINKFDS